MDSNENIRAYNARSSRTLRIRPDSEQQLCNRASLVDSIPPTKETQDAFEQSKTRLLDCLKEWNTSILPTELQKRSGGVPKPLTELQFPPELLTVVMEYTVPTHLVLVLSSKCRHLKERCHFKTTRSVYVSPAADVMDIIHAFLHVVTNELQLTATGPAGKLYDFSVLQSLPATKLPFSSCDREIRLRVQVKREYHHKCLSCYQQFRCIPKGYSSDSSRPY